MCTFHITFLPFIFLVVRELDHSIWNLDSKYQMNYITMTSRVVNEIMHCLNRCFRICTDTILHDSILIVPLTLLWLYIPTINAYIVKILQLTLNN